MNKFFTLTFLMTWLFAADWVVGQEMVLVKDLDGGSGSISLTAWRQSEGQLFFVNGPSDLWVTDGTEAGTRNLHNNYFFFSNVDPQLYMGGYQGVCYFAAGDEEHGREVWRSDGTEEGTYLFADLVEGELSSNPLGFVEFGDYLYIWAYIQEDDRNQLWRTDGTNIDFITEISLCDDGSTHAENLQEFTVTNEAIYFTLGTGDLGVHDCLWKTNGTAEGTMIKKQLPRISEDFEGPVATSTHVFIVAHGLDDFSFEGRLWWAKDTGGSYFLEATREPLHLTPLENNLFFASNSRWGEDRGGIWASDGTRQGTKEIKTFGEVESAYPSSITAFDDLIYFTVNDQLHGTELWVTNGESENTNLIQDIYEGEENSNPRYMTVIGDALYFIANYGEDAFGLYRVVSQTAELVVDYADTDFMDVKGLLDLDGRVLLMNENESNGVELWLYDPLIDNIQAVNWKDIAVQPNPFDQETLISFQNPVSESVSLQLYTVTGQKVEANYQQTREGILVEKGKLKSGVYFFDLISKGRKLGNGKLVVD